MNYVTPTEYDIIEACRLGGCDIFNYDDARKFLLTDNEGKSITNRFISYLICLKIIPPMRQKWALGITKAISLYYDHAEKLFPSRESDPLEIVPVNQEQVMRNDFPRTYHWFEKSAKEVKLDLSKFKDVETRVARIFAVLSRNHKEFPYTQGYDRYAFAFLGLAASWCNNSDLPYDVAEALAYHLTANVISLLPMARLLDKQDQLAAHFDKLDKIFMNYDRPQFQRVRNGGGSLILFGVKWELVLYADDHSLDETFRLWDQVFGRLEAYEDVITALTIAHVCQVQIPPDAANVIEAVTHFNKWNVEELIKTADALLMHHRNCGQVCCEFFCPKLPSFHGYVISPEFL